MNELDILSRTFENPGVKVTQEGGWGTRPAFGGEEKGAGRTCWLLWLLFIFHSSRRSSFSLTEQTFPAQMTRKSAVKRGVGSSSEALDCWDAGKIWFSWLLSSLILLHLFLLFQFLFIQVSLCYAFSSEFSSNTRQLLVPTQRLEILLLFTAFISHSPSPFPPPLVPLYPR